MIGIVLLFVLILVLRPMIIGHGAREYCAKYPLGSKFLGSQIESSLEGIKFLGADLKTPQGEANWIINSKDKKPKPYKRNSGQNETHAEILKEFDDKGQKAELRVIDVNYFPAHHTCILEIENHLIVKSSHSVSN